MLKIENTVLPSNQQWQSVIMGLRNPKNSWERSDSDFSGDKVVIGDKDYNLMDVLSKAGNDHGKYLRMVPVYVDLIAPLYWWKEFDTYKVGTVANSCSTMHKIQAKQFTLGDFSYEHLQMPMLEILKHVIRGLNNAREAYLSSNDKLMWWQMIQLLPSSYNQRRTVLLNYAVLKNMYHSRKNHKLDEWHTFCDWIETLPYSELITKL